MKPLELGFQTIGNATLVCYDGGPVLATDPWLSGPAFFGSWTLTHEVPAEQRAAVAACPWIFVSHALPDHMHVESLDALRSATLLLPDHVGGRMKHELEVRGHRVTVLRDGEWTALSPRLRVAAVADACQDALLLVELGGRLIVDANDAGDRGAGAFVLSAVREAGVSYLLSNIGHEAEMLAFFDEQGEAIPPPQRRDPVGAAVESLVRLLGVDYFVPFSSMHRFQRTDSAWANAHLTPLDAHFAAFHTEEHEVLPPFVHWNFETGGILPLDPAPASGDLLPPEAFGDDWGEELDAADRRALADFVEGFEHLRTFLGAVTFRVGGRDHTVDVRPDRNPRAITLEAPRTSLMTAVREGRFEELLLSNFVRATAHGEWGPRRGTAVLYPDLLPFVCRFGERGGARSAAQLGAYLAAYRRRGFFGLEQGELGRALEPYLGSGGGETAG